MAMDYSTLAFSKGRPAKLVKADRTRARAAQDAAENRKVKARSGGRCEVGEHFYVDGRWIGAQRCHRRAVHVHHLIGGWGKRARGASVLAANKLHVCMPCHSDLHAHVLVPDGLHFRRMR